MLRAALFHRTAPLTYCTDVLSRPRPSQIEAAAEWDEQGEQWSFPEEPPIAAKPVRLPSVTPACLLRRSLFTAAAGVGDTGDVPPWPTAVRTTTDTRPEIWTRRLDA